MFLLSFLFLATLTFQASAQRSTPTQIQIENLYSGEAIDAYDLRPRTMEGSLYFREERLNTAIQLKNGRVMNGVPAKYNLENNSLEIFTETSVFQIPGAAIREFTFEAAPDSEEPPRRYRFLSLEHFSSSEEIEDISFVYFLLEGPPGLLAGYEVEILKPNYVPALDAGSLNSRAVQKERFFLLDDRQLHPIPTRRKRAAELLRPFRPKVDDYLKAARTDLKKRSDLIRLFQWLNEE